MNKSFFLLLICLFLSAATPNEHLKGHVDVSSVKVDAAGEKKVNLNDYLTSMKAEILTEIRELRNTPSGTVAEHKLTATKSLSGKPQTSAVSVDSNDKTNHLKGSSSSTATSSTTVEPAARRRIDQLPVWLQTVVSYCESLWNDANSEDGYTRFSSIFLMFALTFTLMCTLTQVSMWMTNWGTKYWTEFQYRRGSLFSKNEYVCARGGQRQKFYRYKAPPLNKK